MATIYRFLGLTVEKGVAREVFYDRVTAEVAGTITVRKNGGAFGATAGTTSTNIEGNLMALLIHATDADTEGSLVFKCVGTADTVYVVVGQVKSDLIEAADLGANCITNAAIADAALDTEQFAADFLDNTLVADDMLAAENIKTGAFTADAFAADALIAATFATGCITADVFAADALIAATFATDCITADAIANDAINAAEIAADVALELAGGVAVTVQQGVTYVGEVQRNEITAARRTFPVQVVANEAQTVKASKAGGAFATATGATCTQVSGTGTSNVYNLVLAKANVDTLGPLIVEVSGASGKVYYAFAVVEYDPYAEGAMTEVQRRVNVATS